MERGSGSPDERRQRTIEAVVTFTTLVHARERGELTKADDAQRALDRLGIMVRFASDGTHPTQAKGVSRGK